MTLILSLCNSDQVIQLADRRLSNNGKTLDEEANKVGVLYCSDGVFAYGFTGIAKWMDFNTKIWLCSAMAECGPQDFISNNIINRLCDRATSDFKTISSLKNLHKNQKRLSIIFSGYLYNHKGLPCEAILTNFQDNISSTYSAEAWDEFKVFYRNSDQSLNPKEISLIDRVGMWPAMTNNDARKLQKLLLEHRPAGAIIGKAIEIIRDIWTRPESEGTVGKQITVITIPSDHSKGYASYYSSAVVSNQSFMPDIVYAINETQNMVVHDISIRPVDQTAPPITVPKVPKNRLCPCGSGNKYRKCHGKKI